MRTRVLIAVILVIGFVSLGVFAGPLFGSWTNEMVFTVQTSTDQVFQYSLDSIFTLNYAFCRFVGTSFSEFYLPGYICKPTCCSVHRRRTSSTPRRLSLRALPGWSWDSTGPR